MDWGCSAADRCGGEVKGCSLNAGRSGRPGLAEGMLQPALAAGPAAPSSRGLPLHPNRTLGKRVPISCSRVCNLMVGLPRAGWARPRRQWGTPAWSRASCPE